MLSWVVSDADTEGRESFFFRFSRGQRKQTCKMQKKKGGNKLMRKKNDQPLEKVGCKRGT